jgi:hypothetical protein
MIVQMAFQPMPPNISKKARASGGDMMDFDPKYHYIMFEFDYNWSDRRDDKRADANIQQVFGGIHQKVKQYIKKGDLPDAPLPLFMNDAHYAQDFWGRSAHGRFARGVRQQYDPDKFWQNRLAGGFKVG